MLKLLTAIYFIFSFTGPKVNLANHPDYTIGTGFETPYSAVEMSYERERDQRFRNIDLDLFYKGDGYSYNSSWVFLEGSGINYTTFEIRRLLFLDFLYYGMGVSFANWTDGQPIFTFGTEWSFLKANVSTNFFKRTIFEFSLGKKFYRQNSNFYLEPTIKYFMLDDKDSYKMMLNVGWKR